MSDELDGLHVDRGSIQERLHNDPGTTIVKKEKKKLLVNPYSGGSVSSPFTSILGFVLCLLICVALIRISFGYEPIYFSSFLEIILDAPVIDISFTIPTTFLGDWGMFNFLRDILSVSIQVLNFLIYLVNGFINLLSFAFHFLKSLFGVIG